MTQTIRLALVLHNHQPIGNFDGVFEAAYRDSYLPFLEVFEEYPSLKMALHTSGSLMEWLADRHPEYIDRLHALVAAGRVEVVGGAYYEPILPMIPARDRLGQIKRYTAWLEDRFQTTVRGMWMPERVWEQSLVTDLATAGIQYTLLDDFHFKTAGIDASKLHGYYVTEDNGHLLAVFPGSERLRYLIPFGAPQATIDHLGSIAAEHPDAVVVFGDDGEKFGTWPETHRHVYDDGWLRQFFDLLVVNQSWIHTTTPSEALDHVAPVGKIYVPDGSYREMTEWALPTEKLVEYDHLRHELESHPLWPRVAPFIRGGFWRNFKVKYPESDVMYTRMLTVSRKLEATLQSRHDSPKIEAARAELYRAQCNCAYWHGAFGGIYLPHLRNAVFQHLIAADTLLDEAVDRETPWVEGKAADLNLDARHEVLLANDRIVSYLAPHQGGQLYELDVRSIGHNLLATLARRPEAYHHKVLAGANQDEQYVASIHDRVVFKQPDLDQRLQYDDHLRNSLVDHFYDPGTTLDQVVSGHAVERGDFVHGIYEAKIRRNPDRIQVQMTREGTALGHQFRVTKAITLEAGKSLLELAYQLEGLPPGEPLMFACELNFAGLPPDLGDRYFHDLRGNRWGHLGQQLELSGVSGVGLVDEYLGIDVALELSEPTTVWTFPIQTVSQSEAGFELVHQSVAVVPHWEIRADASGRFLATMRLVVDTSLAECRREKSAATVATV